MKMQIRKALCSAVRTFGRCLLVSATLGLLSTRSASAQDTVYPTANTSWTCNNSSITAGQYCAQDNVDVQVFIESSVEWTVGASNIWSQLLNQYDPTDLDIVWDSPPDYSGSSETDIIYQTRSDIPTGFIGMTWCDNAVNGTRCDQHYVAFVSTQPGWDLSCHESGHAMGLTHGQNASPAQANNAAALACMRTPLVTNSWTIGTLNTTNINSFY